MRSIKGFSILLCNILRKRRKEKGLAQCKGDFCLAYILQYISKDVPFNSDQI
jgi:hypothetical protein